MHHKTTRKRGNACQHKRDSDKSARAYAPCARSANWVFLTACLLLTDAVMQLHCGAAAYTRVNKSAEWITFSAARLLASLFAFPYTTWYNNWERHDGMAALSYGHVGSFIHCYRVGCEITAWLFDSWLSPAICNTRMRFWQIGWLTYGDEIICSTNILRLPPKLAVPNTFDRRLFMQTFRQLISFVPAFMLRHMN